VARSAEGVVILKGRRILRSGEGYINRSVTK
jgi:hypothetical protein